MKTKNVILGLCAIVFALGSAFATLDASTLTGEQIKVIESASVNPDICVNRTVCIAAAATCSGSGFQCQAAVSGPNLPSTTVKVRNSSCEILTNSSSSNVATLTVGQCVTAIIND